MLSKNIISFAVQALFLQLKEHSCNLLKIHTILYSYFSHTGQNDNPRGLHCATEARCILLGARGERQCL